MEKNQEIYMLKIMKLKKKAVSIAERVTIKVACILEHVSKNIESFKIQV